MTDPVITDIPKAQVEEARVLQGKISYSEEDLEPSREAWEIAKKCGKYYHSIYVDENGKIRRKSGQPETGALFAALFPGILKSCKGDKQREAVLFFLTQTFKYGLCLPGLGYEFAVKESMKILHSKPGDSRRDMFM